MKAIETAYKGYRFRSRLEARWAVFFDALGVEWEYEKEGFDLGDGLRYLPDFWLPKQRYWIEIKGKAFTREEKERAVRLAAQSGETVYIFSGAVRPGINEWPNPPDGEMRIEGWAWCAYPSGDTDGGLGWVDCLGCGAPAIGLWAIGCPGCGHSATDTPRLAAAYEAARSARFEHGESPRIPEPPKPVAPPVVLPPPKAPPVTLGEVLARLPEVVEAARVNSVSVAALLRGGTPVAVEPPNVVILEFRSEWHRKKMLEAANRVTVEKSLRRVLGYPTRIKCILEPPKPEPVVLIPRWQGNATQFIAQLAVRGIRVSALGGGMLDIQAPTGALTDEIRGTLREHRIAIEKELARFGGSFPYTHGTETKEVSE